MPSLSDIHIIINIWQLFFGVITITKKRYKTKESYIALSSNDDKMSNYCWSVGLSSQYCTDSQYIPYWLHRCSFKFDNMDFWHAVYVSAGLSSMAGSKTALTLTETLIWHLNESFHFLCFKMGYKVSLCTKVKYSALANQKRWLPRIEVWSNPK